MPRAKRISLPSRHYASEYPLQEFKALADLPIVTPAESPRGFLLANHVTQRLAGVVLGNTNFRTDQYDPETTATADELARSAADRQRLAVPALFNVDSPFPGPIVVPKYNTDGSPAQPTEYITETRISKKDGRRKTVVNKAGQPVQQAYRGKPENYIFDSHGLFLAVHDVERIVRPGEPTQEIVVPRSVRAFARLGDISLGLHLPMNPSTLELSARQQTISASFTQRGYGVHFNENAQEGKRGSASAVPIVVRAVARAMMQGSTRIYVPQLEPRLVQEAKEPTPIQAVSAA